MGTAIRKHLGDFISVFALILIALATTVYIIVNQDARAPLPFVEGAPLNLKAEFSDAQAVTPGQGQTIRVAGVEIGKIGKVQLEEGKAVVTMQIEPKYKTLIRRDATALLRPRTGLKDMFIEVDPGSKEAPALVENERIALENTAPDIDPDEILAVLDQDTRDYLQLLVNGLGKGLENRGGDLREVFKRFEPLHRDLAKLNGAIAERRKNLARLVHNYGALVDELGDKDRELVRLVDASNAVFAAFAAEDENISEAVRRLPGTLQTTRDTLVKVESFGRVLGPSLESLRPAFRQLDEANRETLPLVREGEPLLRNKIRPFVRAARGPVRDLRPAAEDLGSAAPDLRETFVELNRFFNMGAHNPGGREGISENCEERGICTTEERERDEGYLFWLAWVVNNTNSLFSTADAQGPFRRGVALFTCGTLEALSERNPLTPFIFGSAGAQAGLCSSGGK